MSEVLRQERPHLEGFQTVKIGLMPARTALYERIERRTHAMLASGWVDEVRSLVARGFGPEMKPFQFIGYSELRAHLAGVVDLETSVRAIQQATRRYAKRQITWFRREGGVLWFEGFGDDAAIMEKVFAMLGPRLKRPAAADR
jgi:tRNA dimethylallyltransferase